MPRRARIAAIDYPHHITQRGNFQQNIFKNDIDRKNYLAWIGEYSYKYGLTMLCYCLMPNHVHFIAIPHKEDSLARTFNTAHMRYSQYMNKKMQRNGHLWQGRFFSCVLDETHLTMAARYVERNPVRAKLVNKPCQWQWSSAREHTNKRKPLIPLGGLFSFIEINSAEWEEYIETKEESETINTIKKHTFVGRPLGNDHFIEKLSKKIGRKIPMLTRGRPKNKTNK